MFLDGPAAEAGLRENDVLERLNGRDVQYSPADVVAMTIRMATSHIVLEIRRSSPTSRGWSTWRPPTLTEIPEYMTTRCPSPDTISCELLSGIRSSFPNNKKRKKHALKY